MRSTVEFSFEQTDETVDKHLEVTKGSDRPQLSIVIPVYNEVDNLLPLHGRIQDVMQGHGYRWEVIYVNDGSTDGSDAVLSDLLRQDERVTVVTQRRNFGKSLALAAGFSLAAGEVIVTMDGDLQDEPGEIPRMLARLDDGYDVVIGWRQARRNSLAKRAASWVANTVTKLATGLDVHDMNSGLKAYRRVCIEKLVLYGDMHRYLPIMAHFAGFRVTEIPVAHHERRFGRSKYGLERLPHGGLDLLTVIFLHQYGRRPLHLFGGGGLLLLTTGFFINLWLTIQWFLGNRPIGDRPLLLLGVLLMLIGFQTITVGLVAELLVSFIQRVEDPLTVTASVERGTSFRRLLE